MAGHYYLNKIHWWMLGFLILQVYPVVLFAGMIKSWENSYEGSWCVCSESVKRPVGDLFSLKRKGKKMYGEEMSSYRVCFINENYNTGKSGVD